MTTGRQSIARKPAGRQGTSVHRKQAETHPGRLVIMVAAIALVAIGLCFRLALYQVVDHSWLSAKAANLSTAVASFPTRGPIYDDVGTVLAISDESYQVQAAANVIRDPNWVAGRLAPLLHRSRASLLRLLDTRDSNVVLASDVPQTTADAITNLGIWQIALGPNPNRVYPEGSLAAHVLGFASPRTAGRLSGAYGVEENYNSLLNGSLTTRQFLRWAHQKHFRGARRAGASGYQVLNIGAVLHLSIDTYMQDVIEQTLKRQVKATGASGGTIIVSQPRTGKIIALANYPWFNPNRYYRSKIGNLSDAAIDYTYEPGSTFKIVTMAAGLNTHVITPNTTIYDPGYISYPQCSPIQIHNWDYPLGNGDETMTEVLQHSANVGASYVANLLGRRRFYRYLRRFGIGTPTGVDLSGEGTGYVPLPNTPNSNWTCMNLYDNAFGQALTVTPLQLLTDVNAVANHGVMMRPTVVSRIDYHGITAYHHPDRIRRVISRRSARTLTNMLVQSAIGPKGSPQHYGEAACALVPGYQVAAKTGTANLTDPQTGRYMTGPGSTIASTVGYAPAFHPRFSVIVIIRKPRFNWAVSQWGSETAAPLVHDVFSALFLHYHIAPNVSNSAHVLYSQAQFGGCTF